MLDQSAPPSERPATTAPRALGEELPIFCESCGYSLHGLTPVRCSHCNVLQFHCPECGHHQPINTLRPAFQRILGRSRAWVLGLFIFFRVNYFLWLLLAWFAMGAEWAFIYDRQTGQQRSFQWSLEAVVGFTCLAVPFAMVGRMFLLRWRRGHVVGMIMGALVVAAMVSGAYLEYFDRYRAQQRLSPYTPNYLMMFAYTFVVITVSSMLAWPIWVAIVRLFLRKPTADALLDWQRDLSSSTAVSSLARQ